jgi:PAS domain S-box-containing protein
MFRHICEAAPDGILVVDREGVITFTNRQLAQMFGYVEAEILGQLVETLLPEPAREAHLDLRAGYVQRPARRPMGTGRHLLARQRDGTEFPVEISLSPFEASGEMRVVAIVRDISERRRMEEEQESLRSIAEREQERQRIAMDLHDGIIQSIYAATLNLEIASDDVNTSPPDAITGINRAIDQLNDTIRDLRGYILDLRPARYGGDLRASIESLIAEFRANSLVEVTPDLSENLEGLSEQQEAAVFHVVQEALNNALKHSRATVLSLRLARGARAIEVDISDNGVGFEPGTVSDAHHGMRNMLSRAASAGGILRVETAPRAGTSVHLEVPLRSQEQPSW